MLEDFSLCRNDKPSAFFLRVHQKRKKADKVADNIILIGFMGVGKGRTARALAAATGRFAIDTDDLIESFLKTKIRTLFRRAGRARLPPGRAAGGRLAGAPRQRQHCLHRRRLFHGATISAVWAGSSISIQASRVSLPPSTTSGRRAKDQKTAALAGYGQG